MKDDLYWCIIAVSLVFAILCVSMRVGQVADAIKENRTASCTYTQQEEKK